MNSEPCDSPESLSENTAIPPIIRSLIQGNYFYVFSAILMMLGCKLLMRSSLVEGEAFQRLLQSLLVLQAFEILVILTAIVIVRHFRTLSDAFTLLVIEILLLLDPTFFSNNFFGLHAILEDSRVLSVNLICFVVAPVKLLIILFALRLRLSLRGFAGFAVAAGFVYLAEGPLVYDQPHAFYAKYYYALSWVPALLALVLPEMSSMVRFPGEAAGFATERQRAWLPRFFLLFPFGVVVAHFFESSVVHEEQIRFYMAHLSPLAIAAGILVIHNKWTPESGKLRVIDMLAFVALLVSWRPFNVLDVASKGKIANERISEVVPGFIEAQVPLIICGGVIAALYLYYYLRTHEKAAFIRLALLALAGCVFCAFHFGLVAWIGGYLKAIGGYGSTLAEAGASGACTWIKVHPSISLGILWIPILALAIKFPNRFFWLAAGLIPTWIALGFLPGARGHWWVEHIQAMLIVVLVVEQRFGLAKDQSGRYALAFAVAGFAIGRYAHNHEFWALGVIAVEAMLLIGMGLLLHKRGFTGIGTLQAIVALGVAAYPHRHRIPPALAVLAAGLILFAAGVIVTFSKQRILRWCEKAFPAPSARPSDSKGMEEEPPIADD